MTTAVSTREQQVTDIIEANRANIEAVLSESLSTKEAKERFLRLCVGAFRKIPKLREATVPSLIEGMLAAGTLGLELNSASGEAFLIPRKIKGVMTACFEVGYQGFITLAARQGIRIVCVECIKANDPIKRVSRGSNPIIEHEVPLSGDRGDVLGAYCCVIAPGGIEWNAYLPIEELNYIRSKARGGEAEDSPWVNWPEEQYKKTAIKRCLKLVPGKGRELSTGLEYDSLSEAGKVERNITLQAQVEVPKALSGVKKAEMPDVEGNDDTEGGLQ